MARTFVIGDIHGAYRALRQCFDRSGFDPATDHLIALGDVADGWPDTRRCVDELMSITHLTYILGNHDFHTLEWMETGHIEDIWVVQGGKATIDSYREGVPGAHRKFFQKALPYFVDHGRLFVHAGIDVKRSIEKQDLQTLLWDRNLARIALDFYQKRISAKLTSFDEVYLGHTPIPFEKPVRGCEVWLMDTGAGWSGTLSIMDIDTKEVFASDPVPGLYPGIAGRSRS